MTLTMGCLRDDVLLNVKVKQGKDVGYGGSNRSNEPHGAKGSCYVKDHKENSNK